MKQFINAYIATTTTALKRVCVLFDDKIIKIAKEEIETEEPVETIDLEGKILLPGAVDIHSHILSSAESSAKDIENMSKAALLGGWTTIAEMSYHTENPLFNRQNLDTVKQVIDQHSYIDLALWGHVDIDDYPYHSEAAQDLWAKGVVGLLLMHPSINPKVSDISYTEIMDLFLDIYDSDTAFAIQGYDLEIAKTYSPTAQLSGIKKVLRRMQENPIHLPRISGFETVEFVNGISKRSDVSYALNFRDMMLHFSEIDGANPLSHAYSERFVELMELFRTNKIYLLSNNAGNANLNNGDIFDCESYHTLKYSYLWALSELWKKRKFTLHSIIKMTSENPAKRMGLYPYKGCLDIGSDADFVIYDPETTTQSDLPILGGGTLELIGAISNVYIRGECVLSPDGLMRKGRFCTRQNSPKRRHNSSTWI